MFEKGIVSMMWKTMWCRDTCEASYNTTLGHAKDAYICVAI